MKKTFGKYCLHCKYWKCRRNWIKWIFIIIGILIIISLVIILLIVLPTTLITTLHIPFGCLNTDFTNTGQIGDTIGGITAPIIGLVSIVLLYITFREQRRFNEEQQNFNEWISLKDMLSNTERNLNYIIVGSIYANKEDAIPKTENEPIHIIDLYSLVSPYTSDILKLDLKEGYVLRTHLKDYLESLKALIQFMPKSSIYQTVIKGRVQASIEKVLLTYNAIEKRNITFQIGINNLNENGNNDDDILVQSFTEDKKLYNDLPTEYLPKWYKKK